MMDEATEYVANEPATPADDDELLDDQQLHEQSSSRPDEVSHNVTEHRPHVSKDSFIASSVNITPAIIIDHMEDTVLLTSLHELYMQCRKPLALYDRTQYLLKHGSPVNFVDDTGCTPLSLLILHVNRGLRYHQFRVPKLGNLEDANAPRRDIFETCAELDHNYEEQVYKSMRALLEHGADGNIMPGACPGIPTDSQWSENYEHKIMQSDQRWNLFTFGGSMEFTTYSIFNPLSRHRPTNLKGITNLHLCAWRGDVMCLDLLLTRGVDVHSITTDNRNALHFLYLYCNKPEHLVDCTHLLTRQGIDVNLVDSNGQTPMLVLLSHFLVKRSHVKYLANSYTKSNIKDQPVICDNYLDEIKQCIELLLEAGAKLDLLQNQCQETPIHHVYIRFEHSLRNCEPEFQVKGHYLVPYHYKLDPLIQISQFLISLGCQVNGRDGLGRTPLHHLVLALRNLSLDEDLNPTHAIQRCFSILLAEGTDVRVKDHIGKTAMHHLVEIVCTTRHALQRYVNTMRLLLSCGADLRAQDNHGNTVLHTALSSNMRGEHLLNLLTFLLQHGADSNQPNIDNKYAINNLMRQHIHHHDPLSQGGVSICLDQYLHTLDLVCRTMSTHTLGYIFSVYRESGFWGVICEKECDVYRLLSGHCSVPRSLKDLCRLVTWKAMESQFVTNVCKLPLPEQMKEYMLSLVN